LYDVKLRRLSGRTIVMRLQLLPGNLAVCRLDPRDPIPAWAAADFFSITRTADELSIVCDSHAVPEGVRAGVGWCALKIEGPLDFALTGILVSIASPLAATGISIFAVSTFDTDYILVKKDKLDRAIDALRAAGHEVGGVDMVR
jgi:uncharacterized protein